MRARLTVTERVAFFIKVALGMLLTTTLVPSPAAAAPTDPAKLECGSVGERCEGLRPGALLVYGPVPTPDGKNYCTFGFILRGTDGHRYATTAGHCLVAHGEEQTWPQGSGVIAYTADGNRVGEFVYAINTREIVPPGLPANADLAVIRLDRGVEADPEVCAFGGPTGIDDRIVTQPDPLEMRWFGSTPVGGRTPPTVPGPHAWLVPARSGYSLGMPRETIVQVSGHASFLDSGGPVLGADGRAVGLVSGPLGDAEELPTDGHAGTFIVTRLTHQLERASEALGVRLSLCCGRSAQGSDQGRGSPPTCLPCPSSSPDQPN